MSLKRIKISGFWRRGVIYAVVLLMLFSSATPFSSVIADEQANDSNAFSPVTYREEGETLFAENGYLQLALDTQIGDFLLTDLKSGTVYRSNPEGKNDTNIKGIDRFIMFSQLTVDVFDKETQEVSRKVSYTGSIMREGFSVEKISGGVRLVFAFPENELTVPLDLYLQDDVFVATVDTNSIKQDGGYLVESFGILPYFGSGTVGDEGYLFVPDGSGAIIEFTDEKAGYQKYSQPIYGSDLAYAGDMNTSKKIPISLPVYGIQREGTAFLAEVMDGAEYASIEASAPGITNMQGNVYAEFNVIGSGLVTIGESTQGAVKESVLYQVKNPLIEVAKVAYHLLPQGGGYTAMALKYRDLLQQRGVQSDTDKENALFCEFVGGVLRKESFLGFYINRQKALTTVEDVEQAVDELGIANTHIIYSDWTEQQIKGSLQTKASVSGKLGSRAKLEQLQEAVGAQNMSLSYDPLLVSKTSWNFWKNFDAAKRIGGEVNKVFYYRPSTMYKDEEKAAAYLLRAKRLSRTFDSFIDSFKKRYGESSLYSATLGNTVYTDFNQKEFGTRTQLITELTDQMEKADVSWTLRAPNAYALTQADVATEIPVDSSEFDLFTRSVPFYALALDGLVTKTVPPVNQDSNERYMLLKALETGSQLYFRFTCGDPEVLTYTDQDGLYYSSFSQWSDKVKELHAEHAAVGEKVTNAIICGHRCVANDVYETVYGNGIRILVNYGEEAATVENFLVPAMGYLVIE